MRGLAVASMVGGVAAATLLVLQAQTHAADHTDAPAVQANPMADITDVYAWMDPGGATVNMVMDVSPFDPGGGLRHFGPTLVYVFHVDSVAGFPPTGAVSTEAVCKFTSDTHVQCWVGDTGYVEGDPSVTAGVASADGKIRVFAGRRSDPFFFNLNGFIDTVATIDSVEGSLTFDAAGCPVLTATSAANLRASMTEGPRGASTHPPCDGTSSDCFIGADVQSIVLQVDKSLLNAGSNTLLSIWASTHVAT
jgi:hypothetical protein